MNTPTYIEPEQTQILIVPLHNKLDSVYNLAIASMLGAIFALSLVGAINFAKQRASNMQAVSECNSSLQPCQ